VGDRSDFANLDDLWYYDSVLRDLDAQDEDSDIAAQREPIDVPHLDAPHQARSSSRPRRHSTAKWQSYKDESESDDEQDFKPCASRRGKEYANARQGVIDRIHQVKSQYGACSNSDKLTWFSCRPAQDCS
jgi:hypothetical protein